MASCPTGHCSSTPPTRKEIRINGVQKELMLDFFKSHLSIMLQGKLDPCLWPVLVQQVNSVPGAPTYTLDEWQSLWDSLRTQLTSQDLAKFIDLDRLFVPMRGNCAHWKIVDESSKVISDCFESGSERDTEQVAKPAKDSNEVEGSNGATVLEKILMRKLVKCDQIKIRYLKRKLKMEGQYHKTKLALMRDMILVKQRKVKVEVKQATALLRIASSLDRLMQNRRLEQF